jgi:hypothetical protein
VLKEATWIALTLNASINNLPFISQTETFSVFGKYKYSDVGLGYTIKSVDKAWSFTPTNSLDTFGVDVEKVIHGPTPSCDLPVDCNKGTP